MKILGISLGHDTNFALVKNGEVIAVKEAERFFRQKRYKLSCRILQRGKVAAGYQYVDIEELIFFLDRIGDEWGWDYDYIALQNQGRKHEQGNLDFLLKERGFKFRDIINVNHHLSHAALALYTSPFPYALVLSYDGSGNDGYTVFFKGGRNELIDYLEQVDIKFGKCYNNIGYIGNIGPDIAGSTAGKTMGLAAYGKVVDRWVEYCREHIRNYKQKTVFHSVGLNRFEQGHVISSAYLEDIPELKKYVRIVSNLPRGWKAKLGQILKGRLFRRELHMPGVKDKQYQDLVATIQSTWTKEVMTLLDKHKYISDYLCVTGGCALNGVTNYIIEKSKMFKDVYFLPNPSDCGLASGAALFIYYKESKEEFKGYGQYFSPYLGENPYDMHEMRKFKEKYSFCELEEGEVPTVLSRLVKLDRIVGVIRGRYEVGPRALGNRSILCNPINKDMRDILNYRVKHREWFRPFAPVITAEDSHKYFTNEKDIPYMSVICYTRDEYKEVLPSITHIDGSARLQTVYKEHNPFLHSTLKEFEKLTGMPIMLNTSFNPKGEPILNFCKVGLEMLEKTDLDLVLIENTLFCAKGKEELMDDKYICEVSVKS